MIGVWPARPDPLPAATALAHVAGGIAPALPADAIGTAADGLGAQPAGPEPAPA